MEFAALTAVVLIGVVLWALIDTDAVSPVLLAGIALFGIVIVGVTSGMERAARRRGERAGELGNVARLLALAAVLVALPAIAVQIVTTDDAPATGFAPHACPEGDVPAAAFADTAEHTHASSVSCAVWWGLASGVDASRFAPDAPVTARQLGTILGGVAEEAGAPDAAAVVDGVPDGAVITRARLAAALSDTYANLSDEPIGPVLDAFRDDEDHALEPDINRAAAAGLVAGTGSRTFAPDDPVTRAQAVTGVLRLLDLLAGEDRVSLPA